MGWGCIRRKHPSDILFLYWKWWGFRRSTYLHIRPLPEHQKYCWGHWHTSVIKGSSLFWNVHWKAETFCSLTSIFSEYSVARNRRSPGFEFIFWWIRLEKIAKKPDRMEPSPTNHAWTSGQTGVWIHLKWKRIERSRWNLKTRKCIFTNFWNWDCRKVPPMSKPSNVFIFLASTALRMIEQGPITLKSTLGNAKSQSKAVYFE